MGIKLFCRSETGRSRNEVAPNPSPGRFKILELHQVGTNVVAVINYLGCTNFEGIKVCVYKDYKTEYLANEKLCIDPHFSEIGLSPFARFIPTKEGIEMAIKFAATL